MNLAVNNITKVQNLQRCESLQKLDLTLNFVPKAGLLSIPSLAGNYNLRQLFLIGNPCTDWHGYRQYIVGKLPQLAKLVRCPAHGMSCAGVYCGAGLAAQGLCHFVAASVRAACSWLAALLAN